MPDPPFYGPELAAVHHEGFGDIAAGAAALVVDRLRSAGLGGGLVVDLGCGSGILARHLTDHGHPVLGIDLSPDMVTRAAATAPRADVRQGSIHDAELPDAAAVVASGEIANYRADERAGREALGHLVGRVRAALVPGGVFAFDLSGPGRAGPTGERTVNRQGAGWFITATSTESTDGRTLDRSITLFDQRVGGHHRRVDEHHTLVLFEPERVEDLCRAHGFTVERRDRYGTRPTESSAPFGWSVFVATVPGP